MRLEKMTIDQLCDELADVAIAIRKAQKDMERFQRSFLACLYIEKVVIRNLNQKKDEIKAELERRRQK